MIYRSNLSAPDLQPHFRNVECRPMSHSMGHSILSDFLDRPKSDPVFGLYKNCGFWTHDEAAILYECASRVSGDWLDIGAHTGWTAMHAAAAGRFVVAVDNMFAVRDFLGRFDQNTAAARFNILPFHGTSNEFFAGFRLAREKGEMRSFGGVVIDGDHERPCPLQDAMNAAEALSQDGVILFHDFIGCPVQEGVRWLMDQGFRCRPYWTPHMVACCWRGEFFPPDHMRDAKIDWNTVQAWMPGFPFERCE